MLAVNTQQVTFPTEASVSGKERPTAQVLQQQQVPVGAAGEAGATLMPLLRGSHCSWAPHKSKWGSGGRRVVALLGPMGAASVLLTALLVVDEDCCTKQLQGAEAEQQTERTHQRLPTPPWQPPPFSGCPSSPWRAHTSWPEGRPRGRTHRRHSSLIRPSREWAGGSSGDGSGGKGGGAVHPALLAHSPWAGHATQRTVWALAAPLARCQAFCRAG